MRSSWRSNDEGQALIVVALCVAVLVGGLAFAVDWGYATAQRRVMQNLADAAALGAGKYLASAVIFVSGAAAFQVTQEQTWCAAKAYDLANRAFAAPNAATQLDVLYGSGASPIVWTTSSKPAGACPTTGGSAVPPGTIYVRVVATTTFSSLIASMVGHTSSTASASARVRLSGSPVPLIGGPMWAMVRHYTPADFNNTCTASPCDTTDPSKVQPVTFWDPNDSSVAFGSFKGLIDFSRNSPAFNILNTSVQTPQLVLQADSSAHPPINPYQIDQTGQNQCPWGVDPLTGNQNWDSWGEAKATADKQCSIPNWAYYGFRGTLALDSHWNPVPAGRDPRQAPSALTARPSICAAAVRPDPAPSCDDPTKGDWVETASGTTVASLSDILLRAVQKFGSPSMPFSDRFVPGSNPQVKFGKGLVVLVFLWDCAESFNSNKVEWTLLGSATDCSQQISGTPARVHLFTVAPFTVYEGTVCQSPGNCVKGYWGGGFGSPDSCGSCDSGLNARSNTAVFVPDN